MLRANSVIPIAVESARREPQGLHLLICDSDLLWVLLAIEQAAHGQALLGSGRGDEVDDRRVRQQRFSTPVLADEGEHPMLDLVPLAGSRWQVTYVYGQAGLIGESLEFPFPQTQAHAITASAVNRDEQ